MTNPEFPAGSKAIYRSPHYGYRWAVTVVTGKASMRDEFGLGATPIPHVYCHCETGDAPCNEWLPLRDLTPAKGRTPNLGIPL